LTFAEVLTALLRFPFPAIGIAPGFAIILPGSAQPHSGTATHALCKGFPYTFCPRVPYAGFLAYGYSPMANLVRQGACRSAYW
jgi:hypothetical protein